MQKFEEYEADFAVSDEEDHQIVPKATESKSHALIQNDNMINQSPLKDVNVQNLNSNLIPRGADYPANDRQSRNSKDRIITFGAQGTMSVVYKRNQNIDMDLFYDSRDQSNERRQNLTEMEVGGQTNQSVSNSGDDPLPFQEDNNE